MKWLLALLTLIGLGSFALTQAHAQQWQPGGTGLPMVCAYNGSAPTYTDKWFGYVQCDINGNLKTTGGGGGSGATAYLQTNAYTPITTSSSSAPTTISAGSPTVVVAVNVGSTNGAYCAPGTTATSSDHYLAPGGGWFAWNPNSATTLSCIQAGGPTIVNVTGGSGGLPTGSGGGGGGSGSGNVFQATAFTEGTASAAATTQVFALSGSTIIYLVNYAYQTDAAATGNGTFQIVTGTGTNCSTIHQTLTPVWNFAQSAGIAEGSIGVLGASTAGDEMCVVTTASQKVDWRIGVVQQ